KASLDPEYSTSYLDAINEFFASLDQLRLKRRDIQRRRTVEDSAIFPLFREPFRPSFYDVNYWTLQRKLVHSFGLDGTFFKEGSLMKEQLIGYEHLIEDLYRLQREAEGVHRTQLAEARQEGDALRRQVGELDALVQARDGQLAEAHREAEALRGRVAELEPQLAEAHREAEALRGRVAELEPQLAETRDRVSALEAQIQLQEHVIQTSMRRLDEFLEEQSRRLSTRIVNFLFWAKRPRP
ncbi:MAG TPA: hypothetical protein VFF86_06060, partial [Candidatus Methylomirabilis sp.]|nr:hypothetical protein [Candidatus Methylomirabilis sp.]